MHKNHAIQCSGYSVCMYHNAWLRYRLPQETGCMQKEQDNGLQCTADRYLLNGVYGAVTASRGVSPGQATPIVWPSSNSFQLRCN